MIWYHQITYVNKMTKKMITRLLIKKIDMIWYYQITYVNKMTKKMITRLLIKN